jgi:exonuclease SbcC
MLIDQLTTRAFRGITHELKLDLTARVTLIHAPNGTGKSSLCDSVEWLLTGEIFRFREALGKSSTEGVRSLFSDENPAVECVLRANGETLTVRRTNVGDASHIESLHSDQWMQESLESLLAKLTPGTLPPSSHAAQRLLGRKNWLRAVRFLAAPSLDLLLDCSKDADDVRSLVFSDLLGIGELQRDQRDLEKILKDIGSKTQLNRLLRDAQNSVVELETEITAETATASAPLYETFDAQLAAAIRRLQVPAPAVTDAREQQLAHVANAYENSVSRLRRKQQALVTVTEKAVQYEAQILELANFRQSEDQIVFTRNRFRTELVAANEKLEELVRKRTEMERRGESLSQLRVTSLNVTLNAALEKWSQFSGETSQVINPVAEQTQLESLQNEHLQVRQRSEVVNRCLENALIWREALLTLRTSEQKLLQINIPSTEDEASLEELLNRAQSSFRDFADQYDRLTGPLERLRAAGREFLSGAPQDKNCPLCAHDHGTHQALEDAMATGLAAIPLAMAAIVEGRAEQERRIAELQGRRKRWTEEWEKAQMARAEASRCGPIIEEARSALAGLQISVDRIGDDALSAELEEQKVRIDVTLQELSRRIQAKHGTLEATQALLRVANDIDSVHRNIRALLPDLSVITRVSDLAPSSWASILGQTDEFVLAAYELNAAQLAERAELEQSLQLSLSQSQQQATLLDQDLQATTNKIITATDFRREFLTEWHVLEGDVPWSLTTLDTVPLKLEAIASELARAQVELVSAQTALANAVSVSSRERELIGRRRRLAMLKQEVQKADAVINLRNQCENGVSALRSAKETFTSQQIKPLLEVITALYVRAQSNGFIDRIETSAEAGPLRWLPQVADRQLEDPVQMSQGQRQDLALSIFLARARDLGGTFFLDEPLLHLDDLNRVALLDVLRVIAAEDRPKPLRLVLTTASYALVRHCREKLALVSHSNQQPALRVYRLRGDPRSGVTISEDI